MSSAKMSSNSSKKKGASQSSNQTIKPVNQSNNQSNNQSVKQSNSQPSVPINQPIDRSKCEIVAAINIFTPPGDGNPSAHLLLVEKPSPSPSPKDLTNQKLQSYKPTFKHKVDQLVVCSQCLPLFLRSKAVMYCVDCCEWLCQSHLMMHDRRTQSSTQAYIRTLNESFGLPTIQSNNQSNEHQNHQKHAVDKVLADFELRRSLTRSIKSPTYMCDIHQLKIIFFCNICYTTTINQSIDQKKNNSQSSDQTTLKPYFLCTSCLLDHPVHSCLSVNTFFDQTAETAFQHITEFDTHDIISLIDNIDLSINQYNVMEKQSISRLNDVFQLINRCRDQTIKQQQKLRNRLRLKCVEIADSLNDRLKSQTTTRSRLIEQSTIITRAIAKMDFNKLHQSINQSNNQLISQSIKLSKAKAIKKRLAIKVDFHNEHFGDDIDAIIDLYSHDIKMIFTHWFRIQVEKMTQKTTPIDLTFDRSTGSLDMDQNSSDSLVSDEIHSKDQTNVVDESKTQPIESTTDAQTSLPTNSTNNQSSNRNQTLNQSSSDSFQEDVDVVALIEAPELTWPVVLKKMKAVTGRSMNQVILDPQSDNVALTLNRLSELSQDVLTLCLSPSLCLMYFDENDYSTIVWFLCSNLFVGEGSINRPLSEALILFLANFPVRLQNMASNHFIETRLLIDLLAGPSTGSQPHPSFLMFKTCIDFALGADQNTDLTNLKRRSFDLPAIRVNQETALQVVPYLKTRRDIRTLHMPARLDDNVCQMIGSSLKHLPELRRLDIGFGTVSDATLKGLFSGLARFSISLCQITLRGCERHTIISNGLKSLDHLQLLDLCNLNPSGCESVARALPHLTNLIEFQMHDSNLGKVGAEALAISLPLMRSVRRFGMRRCKIDDFVAEDLMDSLVQCVQLTHLWFESCNLDSDICQHLFKSAHQLVLLEKLSLDNNPHMNPDFSSLVGSCHQLKELSLWRVGAFDAAPLTRLIAKCPLLRSLRAAENRITNLDMLVIRLTYCSDLEELDFTQSCTPSAMVTLAKHFNLMSQIRVLKLLNGGKIDDQASHNITSHLVHLKNVKELNIAGVQITSVSAFKFRDFLLVSKHLLSVDLTFCGFTSKTCEQLAEGLAAVRQLSSLTLSGNSIKNKGLSQLCAPLSKMPQLRYLLLGKTELTSAAGRTIGTLLRRLPALAHLDLSFNKLEDGGIEAVAEELHVIPRLQILILDTCYFGDVGMKALCEGAKSLRYLTEINIQNARLSRNVLERAQKQFGTKLVLEAAT